MFKIPNSQKQSLYHANYTLQIFKFLSLLNRAVHIFNLFILFQGFIVLVVLSSYYKTWETRMYYKEMWTKYAICALSPSLEAPVRLKLLFITEPKCHPEGWRTSTRASGISEWEDWSVIKFHIHVTEFTEVWNRSLNWSALSFWYVGCTKGQWASFSKLNMS